MAGEKPTFRVMKNGYDRFAVDDAIEHYTSEISQLEKTIELYKESLIETTEQFEDLKEEYNHVMNTLEARTQAADQIARLSLREANEIIETAHHNADDIVSEALTTARLLITDLARLYENADSVKAEVTQKLETLLDEMNTFELPRMPDLKWLEEAEEKMH